MNKYIVKVNTTENTIFITLKAKDSQDLEYRIAKELIDIFGSLDEINSIEYEQVKRFTFSKKECHWFVGDTYVGGACLQEIYDEVEENDNNI